MRDQARIRLRAFVALAFVATVEGTAVLGQGLFSGLKDEQDGKIDLSDYVLSRHGVLPVPIVITEPAVGYGGGIAPVWIKRAPGASDDSGEKKFQTPMIFGAAGFYTASKTWGAGAGGFVPIDADRFRVAAIAAYVDANLKFYGFGADSPFQKNPVAFDIKGATTFERAQARVGSTDLFAGIQYLFLSTRSKFSGGLPPEITSAELDIDVGGLGGMLEYDTRDNFLSPQKGLDVFVDGTAFEPAFGGDVKFGNTRFQTLYYERLSPHWGFGLRLDARYAWGDVPFFARPNITMRGLTTGQYSDKVAILVEAEPRYWIDSRWMLLVFGGVGRTAKEWSRLDDSPNVWATGFGFRYLLARKLGLQAGLDFGFGPSGSHAFYIQVGSAWR